jgi:imidazolonepropionase-like amidohydrolase
MIERIARTNMKMKIARRTAAVIIALVVGGFAGLILATQDPGQKPAVSRIFAVKNARVFDGEKMIEGATVVVRDGKIFSVGVGPADPGKGSVLDAKGQTLLPGLFDAHVHTWSEDQLRQATIFGVTTVIDMFMSPEMMKAMKAAQAGGRALDRAFLVSPGALATVAGGHGTQFGLPIPTIEPATDIRAYVDDRIAEGSDFIKIIQDDGSAYRFPRPTLTDTQVAALIEAAHARGKKAVIHAALLKNCLAALNAGVDGLAHLYFEDAADPDFGALAARKKAFVIPTLSVLRGMSGIGDNGQLAEDGHLAPFLKPEDFSGLNAAMGFKSGEAAYAAAEKALRQLKAAGVPILAGTDAPNPGTTYGASLHGELELLVKAGLSPLEVLRAATSVPADHFGHKERGRIRPGMTADLVLVNGDPSKDIRATRDIVQVWRGGVALNREAYRRTVRQLRDQAADLKSAPSPEYGTGGRISDFERGKIEAAFGTGWVVSTDVFYGGKSKAVIEWTAGGAQGSSGAMKIAGEILEGAPNRFSGAMFSPGRAMMQPVNLSNRKAVSFWAKAAAPRTCILDLFVQSRGFRPVMATFLVGPEWKEYTFSFADLKIDGVGLMAVFIGAFQDLGPFTMWIDNVRFQ